MIRSSSLAWLSIVLGAAVGCGASPDGAPSSGEPAASTTSGINTDGTIRSVRFGNKCLSTDGYTSANGTPLILWDCLGQDNQAWSVAADGTIRGFGGKCVTTNGYTSADGTGLVLWDCLGQDNQKWSTSDGGPLVGFGGKCVSTNGYTYANGTGLMLWSCLGQDNQIWSVPATQSAIGSTSSSLVTDEYSWTQGDPPRTMLNESQGFCFLTRLIGKFEGDRESVVITVDAGRNFVLSGSSMQEAVGGGARCVTWDQVGAATGQIVSYGDWIGTGRAPNENDWGVAGMPDYCYLSGVRGAFAYGGGEYVSTTLESGAWRQHAGALSGTGTSQRTICVQLLNARREVITPKIGPRIALAQSDSNAIKESTYAAAPLIGGSASGAQTGVCMLGRVQGHFAGGAEEVAIRSSAPGWTLNLRSNQHGVGADAQCLYF